MLKVNVLQAVSGKYEFVSVSAPIIVKDDGANTFEKLVNSMLFAAYECECRAKKAASEKTIASAKSKMFEYEEGTEEREKAASDKTRAEKTLANTLAMIDSLEAVRADIDSDVTSDEAMTTAARMFSYLYSNARMIDSESGTVVHGYLKGINPFYVAVAEYADKYESTPDTWAPVRIEEFNALKASLTEIGGRLNNDGSNGLAKFLYKPTSKAVNELVARYTSYTKFAKKSGKFGMKRDNVEKFQQSVISIIFKLDKVTITKNSYIED